MNKFKLSFLNPLKPPPPPHPAAAATKSFNATINRLSTQNAHQQVLLTYSSMLKTNTSPDAHTFPSLLKACTSLHLLSLGLSLHQQLIVTGFSSDAYTASSLISFYAKFSYTEHARKVFDEMSDKNVVPWTAIIGCYSRVGDVGMAFAMYGKMQHEGIEPSSVTLLSMLSGVSELVYVQCLHGCVIKSGFGSDTALVNSMLNVYGKCGSIEDARDLFETMDQRDVISWNSLLSGYDQIGYVRETLQLLSRMRMEDMEPNQQTFGSVASVIATKGEVELGRLVHGQILRVGFELDPLVETSLIGMYLMCGNVDDAFRIFNRSLDKDVILYTTMISGLVQKDCADKALMVFLCMLESGIIPSNAIIASSLAACTQLGSFQLGAAIHGYILRQKIPVDIPAQNSLVTMYSKSGSLEQSFAVFDQMEERDVVSWNAIIAGYAQNGHLCKAFFLFNEMRAALQRPDSVTVVSLFQACASIGALHQGKWIHNFIIRSCVGPCILVDTALINMYSKCGDLDAAQKCFDRMSEHDLISWSTIIAGYGSHGKGETALRMYAEFLRAGFDPNHVIFLSVLSACSHNGLVHQGLSLFKSMTEDFQIKPKLEHCACIVDLLSRAGRVEEAYNFYKRMFMESSIDVLGIILDACRTRGNVELGDIIAKDIRMLKPVNAGNYVQLAHSYASMNRWDGMGEAWIQMRSLGLRKLPGWSFLELHGTITTFYNNHGSHPRFEEIMLVLSTLSWEMRKSINFKTSRSIS